jgi:hypothetical protein
LNTLGGGNVDPQEANDDPINMDDATVVHNVLCRDWDILIDIQCALAQLPGMTLQFIKGHHDDKSPYAQL